MFFNGWDHVGRVALMALCSYAALIAILRMSGKRTLSKMNAFDLVVTVALGSTLATIILSKDVALVEGVAALGMLVLLQFVVTWFSVRSAGVRKLVRSEPTLLCYRGKFLRDAMKTQRVTETEVRQAVRSQGAADLGERAVVLETDGRFSVLPVVPRADVPAMRDVAGGGV